MGVSLGINLLPIDKKICSFDCIYCECGLNRKTGEKGNLPTRAEVKLELENKLREMSADHELPDVITFAGNGEPTLHPEFAGIIDDVLSLRQQLCPSARIAVLSNSTRIDKQEVFDALLKIDDNILKLESGLQSTIEKIDRPNASFDLNKLVDNLIKFNGQLIIQTMFIKGTFDGISIDNTGDEDIESWIELLKKIKPRQVMIYTIERDTPTKTLEKVSIDELNQIAEKVRMIGIPVNVSG